MARRAREFYVYQKRQAPEMWALQIVVDIDTKRKPMREFDVTMFADFIPRSNRADSSLWHRRYMHPEEFTDDIATLCRKYGQDFTDEDKAQLFDDFINIIMCA